MSGTKVKRVSTPRQTVSERGAPGVSVPPKKYISGQSQRIVEPSSEVLRRLCHAVADTERRLIHTTASVPIPGIPAGSDILSPPSRQLTPLSGEYHIRLFGEPSARVPPTRSHIFWSVCCQPEPDGLVVQYGISMAPLTASVGVLAEMIVRQYWRSVKKKRI